ncbi:hypothetical protein [Aeromicrobium alkaliterrae]|uniref:Uncharacterized protein n=1 Tax=Aeromicrobium alkaliterrae TaxID=302168 RepID=A0ABN2JM17_9ACTN
MASVQADDPQRRADFYRRAGLLTGRTLRSVQYWDVLIEGSKNPRWDFGDWHHVEMGVELETDVGPVTITWSNAFFPYGVDVFDGPMRTHFVGHSLTPIGPALPGRCEGILGTSVRSSSIMWETVSLGPGRLSDGTIVSSESSFDLPLALRLDFDAGHVWFVVANPCPPEMKTAFAPGDEVMVVFTRERLSGLLGIDDGSPPAE